MALDVYVGSLTRYYSGDWESAAEKIARERGVRYEVVKPGDPKDKVKEADRIRPALLAWRRKLGDSLGKRIASPLSWDESAKAPYFTGRPGWDGFGSLVLWAAYAEHPALRPPPALAEEWDDDVALLRSNGEGFKSRYSHLVRNIELWLPSRFEITFEAEDAVARKTVIGSSTTLRQQLADLNAATWRADEDAIAGWQKRPPPDEAGLEGRARFAFSILSDLANLAHARQLPMKLDY